MKNYLRNIKIRLKKLNLLAFLIKYLEDFLILSGLIVIITATFLLSFIAGMYCLGFILLGLGIFFTKYPMKRK